MILDRSIGKTWEQVVITLDDIPELKNENAHGSIYPNDPVFEIFKKQITIYGKKLSRIDIQGNEAQLSFT